MSSRLVRATSWLMCVLLLFVMGGNLFGAAPAAQAQGLQLPWYLELVQASPGQTWEQRPGSQQSGPLSAVVHLDSVAPLALVADRTWSHAQRIAHVAKIRAAQDSLIPQIEGMGGKIRGRLTHLAAGLAVEIDSSRADDLRALGGVLAVKSVGTYQLDLSETAGFIGARALAAMGVTGAGVDVAVIDSGVDYTHVKLGGPGTVAAYNEAYCGDAAIAASPFDPACAAAGAFDAPAAGFFGDPQYGRDGSPINKVVGGWDWVGEYWPQMPPSRDPNPIDYEGHGTHVADIIGGLESAPGAGDAGVAPGANIWAFKACSAIASSCEGTALLLALDDAMDLDDSDYGMCTPGVDPYCMAYDPADVVNMSLGAVYGQPEDDLTLFADIASYYGSLMVVSAGNSGDRPYIVGSPSTAAAAVSVAQSTVPSDALFAISVNNSVAARGVLQAWSPAPGGPLAGALQYGDGAGGNLLGCEPFAPGSLTGKVLLVDRGSCNVSLKGSNGSAAGAAFVLVANNVFSNTPPSFSLGAGTITVPTLSLTQNDGFALRALAGQTASISPAGVLSIVDDIVATSSRGPRIADGAIKPDIAAPGGSISAEAGTGSGKTAFGGTSGAAPMVAGAAALIIETLEKRGLLNSDPGLDGPISLAPVVKSILMNNANGTTYIGGSGANGGRNVLAPITLQGAGRVDALKAAGAETVAWDATEFDAWLSTGVNQPCGVAPAWDVYIFDYLGIPPDCADDYPFGNDFFNAWNKQTGSLSFGYDGYAATAVETRKLRIANVGAAARTYNLSSAFRYSDDEKRGVEITVIPSTITVAAGDSAIVEVRLQVSPNKLRDWTLDAGQFGASGTSIFCSSPDPVTGCPTLQIFEYDGYVTVDGGANNRVQVPWQILPKRAANTVVAAKTASEIRLRNSAGFNPGETEVFSLLDVSPNNCEVVDENYNCVEPNYVPGILPGVNATAIDIKEVGVRSYQIAGLNAALGVPAAPGGARNDEVVDFALSVYDAPFRASHNYPVEFDIYVDSDADGRPDYVVFNSDLTLNAADGRNAVFVADINFSDGFRPLRPYFFSNTSFNSQNWILPVPAAAIGVRSDQPFNFFVLAFDAYFTGDIWDCSPYQCGSYHTYQTGLPRFQPANSSLVVPVRGNYRLGYSAPSGGAAASPSQSGLLLFYRDAAVGRESEAVTLP